MNDAELALATSVCLLDSCQRSLVVGDGASVGHVRDLHGRNVVVDLICLKVLSFVVQKDNFEKRDCIDREFCKCLHLRVGKLFFLK